MSSDFTMCEAIDYLYEGPVGCAKIRKHKADDDWDPFDYLDHEEGGGVTKWGEGGEVLESKKDDLIECCDEVMIFYKNHCDENKDQEVR
jgi:hypothetical protein